MGQRHSLSSPPSAAQSAPDEGTCPPSALDEARRCSARLTAAASRRPSRRAEPLLWAAQIDRLYEQLVELVVDTPGGADHLVAAAAAARDEAVRTALAGASPQPEGLGSELVVIRLDMPGPDGVRAVLQYSTPVFCTSWRHRVAVARVPQPVAASLVEAGTAVDLGPVPDVPGDPVGVAARVLELVLDGLPPVEAAEEAFDRACSALARLQAVDPYGSWLGGDQLT